MRMSIHTARSVCSDADGPLITYTKALIYVMVTESVVFSCLPSINAEREVARRTNTTFIERKWGVFSFSFLPHWLGERAGACRLVGGLDCLLRMSLFILLSSDSE